MFNYQTAPILPKAAGIGFKSQHFYELLSEPGPVQWLEIHAENYLGAGGRPRAQLAALRDRYAISVHGVGLSIGAQKPLDKVHLSRLRMLCDWLQPAAFSEHLAWSTHSDGFLNDLLPLPYNNETLRQVCAHIDEVQETLGRVMMLENPSSYMAFADSTWAEPEFIAEVSRRTGCALLLDINNVFISAKNLGFGAIEYLDAYPLERVREIHLAGHHTDDLGNNVLYIDSHSAPVDEKVWHLLDYTLARTDEQPILIEWDNEVPSWATLRAEAIKAQNALGRVKAMAAQ